MDQDHNRDDDDKEEDEYHVEISPETLYTIIGVCAGGLLAIILLILTAVYCRRKKWREVCSNIMSFIGNLSSVT